MSDSIKQLAQNRKARHDYFVESTYEAGIELFGTEVKSMRAGEVNLKDSYAIVRNAEVYIIGMHISPYEAGNIFNRDPLRDKRLLLHKAEIRKLEYAVSRDGLTLIPLSVYLKGSRVKVELGVCRGKKNYDKRDSVAKRDVERSMQRAAREFNKQ